MHMPNAQSAIKSTSSHNRPPHTCICSGDLSIVELLFHHFESPFLHLSSLKDSDNSVSWLNNTCGKNCREHAAKHCSHLFISGEVKAVHLVVIHGCQEHILRR